jgi:FHA domain-containing protein
VAEAQAVPPEAERPPSGPPQPPPPPPTPGGPPQSPPQSLPPPRASHPEQPLPPAPELTGDAAADEDIRAFLEAKQRRMAQLAARNAQ